MRVKRICCRMIVGLMLMGSLCINAGAMNSTKTNTFGFIEETRASGNFTVKIEGGATARAETAFPLSAKETVQIDAIFSPRSTNLDVGLLAPDGNFYYLNIDGGGDIDETIRVEEMGNYTLQIRNNSEELVIVTGFVYY